MSDNIDALYQEHLGRAPDPSGRRTFAGMSDEDIIAGITGSQEYQNRRRSVTGPGEPLDPGITNRRSGFAPARRRPETIEDVYYRLLGRAPDTSGRVSYAGKTPGEIAASVVRSKEYLRRFSR